MTIKPSIGRVVWFWPSGKSQAEQPGSQPLAAIVTYVWSDHLVNLTTFDSNGVPTPRTSVPLIQEGDTLPTWAFAQWMPYQIGQARKHAEAASA